MQYLTALAKEANHNKDSFDGIVDYYDTIPLNSGKGFDKLFDYAKKVKEKQSPSRAKFSSNKVKPSTILAKIEMKDHSKQKLPELSITNNISDQQQSAAPLSPTKITKNRPAPNYIVKIEEDTKNRIANLTERIKETNNNIDKCKEKKKKIRRGSLSIC